MSVSDKRTHKTLKGVIQSNWVTSMSLPFANNNNDEQIHRDKT